MERNILIARNTLRASPHLENFHAKRLALVTEYWRFLICSASRTFRGIVLQERNPSLANKGPLFLSSDPGTLPGMVWVEQLPEGESILL